MPYLSEREALLNSDNLLFHLNIIDYENVSSKKEMLQQLLSLRKQYNEGNQEDYFNHPHLIGWIRRTQTKTMAIIMTNSTGGIKSMYVGKEYSHCYYVNVFNGYQRVLFIVRIKTLLYT